MGRKSIERTSRLQVILEERSLRRLKKVQGETGAPSMSATCVAALELYSLVISAQQEGAQILVIKETDKGRHEKEVLFF